jgi:histidine triad (HIT) family protein
MVKPFMWLFIGLVCSSGLYSAELDQLYRQSFTFDQVSKDKWVLESDNAYVIEDIAPKAPIHLLVISKRVLPTILDADKELLGEMLDLGKQAAVKYGIDQTGFRTVINTHPEGGQGVYHIHMHILGGRQMRKPLG